MSLTAPIITVISTISFMIGLFCFQWSKLLKHRKKKQLPKPPTYDLPPPPPDWTPPKKPYVTINGKDPEPPKSFLDSKRNFTLVAGSIIGFVLLLFFLVFS